MPAVLPFAADTSRVALVVRNFTRRCHRDGLGPSLAEIEPVTLGCVATVALAALAGLGATIASWERAHQTG